ncbi:MAG: serine--tRNA ligase [Alphaproteobacteria bacterium]|nr:serine--tRNA ligase [Alphaproteobacteria bacterium]
MHDLRAIRDNPQAFDDNWARRGLSAQTPAILALDEERRAVQTDMQELQQQRNEKSKQIGQIKSQGGDAQAIMNEVSGIKEKLADREERERILAEELNAVLSALPNLLADDVPDGPDESANVEIRRNGEPPRPNAALQHFEIGEKLGMMDFETAAKLSGARFVLMHSGLARLERALAQFMLDTHTGEHGYTEVSPPLLVRDDAMYGTGQLPKFTEDLFQTTRGDWLIPTAEVSLTNIVADRILDTEELPLRFTAWTPCFRSEAGSAGKDTRGIIRQHQFYKVEMVCIVAPDKSNEEHERMTDCAENILKKLGLAFRTITLCSGDTGFCARKTYDIEVWLPGQNAYREISSCSNCWDFQARRMKARFRPKGTKETQFLHTLNGSGVAVGRALVAVLENYHDPSDGGVFVPDVLKPYMGGIEKLLPASGA